MSQNLARRSITSVKWNAAASVIGMVVGLVQATILARLLPVETFGIYAAAASVITLTAQFANFGLTSAFVHRAQETEDINQAAAVFFTLKLIFTAIWAALLILGILFFSDAQQSDLRTAFLVITLCEMLMHIAQTPRIMLVRQIQHRRLAVMDMLETIVSAVITIGLALSGATLWALLAGNFVSASLNLVGLYLWRPVWRPQVTWTAEGMRYFLRFGSRTFLAHLLATALDRLDDIWTGSFLGTEPLGFYSRAYRFSKIPSAILAVPINTVAAGTYAEIQTNRALLSQAFERINALMVRSGFLMAGLIALTAPEFIRIVLGERWLPMLDAFRLMLVFTLFDPMKQTIASLFIAGMGQPGLVARIRLAQLAILLIGLFALGIPFDIAGVALAVDIMMVVGIGLMMWQARKYVDFSFSDLFKIPVIAICAALITGTLAGQWVAIYASDWLSGIVKTSSFLIVYVLVLLLWDRKHVQLFSSIAKAYLFK